MTFGQKLQNLRKMKAMSQEALANELGVSRQAVSRWELDISLPETENIIKIKDIFNVSFDYMLDENITDTDTHVATQQAATHTGRNVYVDNIITFLKKYGYYGGYILSAVSAYCFAGYTITFFGLMKFITPADGFDLSYLTGGMGISGAMTGILIMYIILSLAGAVGGVYLAKYLKKKTEKYRVNTDSEVMQNNRQN